jgi:DNA gyrase subunit A
MGVKFVTFKGDDRVVTIARNTESAVEAAIEGDDETTTEPQGDDA